MPAELMTKRPERPRWRAALVTAALALGLPLAVQACHEASAGNDERQSVRLPRASDDVTGEEVAVLTHAPNVPPPITRRHATKVIVNLNMVEKKERLADGVEYIKWTFGGEVPGMFIRVREGDVVEMHLKNDSSSTMPHNIDLHAVNGQGGGAQASLTMPGHESVFTFSALNPGLFAYHCAMSPVPMHIANGMYGLILVEPKEGLPKVDREFYLMQSEFCTKGKYGSTQTMHNVQTTTIPAGGSAVVELGLVEPGDFLIVDHAVFRAFNKGAQGILHVTGPADTKIFAPVQCGLTGGPTK